MKHNISTTIGKHTFSLKNVEVYERMSEETTAFVADIYLDGELIGDCKNSGKGEGNFPNIYVSQDKMTRDEWKAKMDEIFTKYGQVQEELKKHHYHSDKTKDYPYECDWDYDMDFLIAEMVYFSHYYNRTKYVLPKVA